MVVKIVDVMEFLGQTDPPPGKPGPLKRLVRVPEEARDIYVSRTYGYVAAGRYGLVVLDLTKPEDPAVAGVYPTDPAGSDARAVRVGMTNSSMFAYVADGRNGLKVMQLTSGDAADGTPGYLGFSPAPKPRLIAR
jgi:hypothetical protein